MRWFEKLFTRVTFDYNELTRLERIERIEKFLKSHPNWLWNENKQVFKSPSGILWSYMCIYYDSDLVLDYEQRFIDESGIRD